MSKASVSHGRSSQLTCTGRAGEGNRDGDDTGDDSKMDASHLGHLSRCVVRDDSATDHDGISSMPA